MSTRLNKLYSELLDKLYEKKLFKKLYRAVVVHWWFHQFPCLSFFLSFFHSLILFFRSIPHPASVCHFSSGANSTPQTSRKDGDQRAREGDRESEGSRQVVNDEHRTVIALYTCQKWKGKLTCCSQIIYIPPSKSTKQNRSEEINQCVLQKVLAVMPS